MMRVLRVRMLAIVVAAALASNACAMATARSFAPSAALDHRTADQQPADPAVLAEFVQKLPPGSAIRVDHTGGKSIRGTLIKTTPQSLIVQPKTRIPEPPVEIPYTTLLRVAPENGGSNVGKTIGIAIAAGAGATLGVLLILAAIFSD